MPAGERGTIDHVDEPSYLSFAQYDARQFGGGLTRGFVEAYLDGDRLSVWSAGAGAAELETVLAAETDWTIRAIDVDETIVAGVRERSLPPNLTVAVGDACDPASSGIYDVAIAFGSIQELVGRPVEGLRGLRDSLRPGGISFVAVPNLASVLRLVRPAYVHLDEDTLDVPLAYAEHRLTNGASFTQYGFVHEGQSMADEPTDELDFDPAATAPLTELASRAGLEPAETDPLRTWANEAHLLSVDGERVDGFALDAGESFPASLPVDPSGLVGEAAGPPIQDAAENFDPFVVDPLAATVAERGVSSYRLAQARDPTLPPRVDLYAFRRPG